jgi:hypothetical protein
MLFEISLFEIKQSYVMDGFVVVHVVHPVVNGIVISDRDISGERQIKLYEKHLLTVRLESKKTKRRQEDNEGDR